MPKFSVEAMENLIMRDEAFTTLIEIYPHHRYQVDEAVSMLAEHEDTEHLISILLSEDVISQFDGYIRGSDNLLVETASLLHKQLFNREPLVQNQASNLLLPASPDADWHDRYRRLLTEYVVEKGKPMSNTASYYSWGEYDNPRPADVKIVWAGNVRENGWREFNGTFNSEDDFVAGATLEVIWSDNSCGRLRFEGSFTPLMRSF